MDIINGFVFRCLQYFTAKLVRRGRRKGGRRESLSKKRLIYNIALTKEDFPKAHFLNIAQRSEGNNNCQGLLLPERTAVVVPSNVCS